MMASTTATPTAIAMSLATWLRGAFMAHAWVVSVLCGRLTKARNSAVLLEVSASSLSGIAATLAGRTGHQPGKPDHAPGADHERLGTDPLDHPLEMADVSGPDVQQRVRLPGDRGGAGHLRVPAHG